MTKSQNKKITRPPVVAVMGHIDHGKSSLLDYIRKSNVAGGEAGGITQHISAYEVVHSDKEGVEKKITFLDTPGHEAFGEMRSRGAKVADIAILVIAADDGVKPQTLEAYKSIEASGIPFIVAVNKIDKPDADIEKTKQTLAENNIFLEGYGGHVSWVAISAKTGEGIDELLEMILLQAEIEGYEADISKNALGVVIESSLDPKKGIAASLIIKEGSLKSGQFVVAEDSFAPTRIMEDFLGKSVKEIFAGSPVRVVGFNKLPSVGARFSVVSSKKEAEKLTLENKNTEDKFESEDKDKSKIVPVVVKADVAGLVEAILSELKKLETEKVGLKILYKGTGDITENDIKAFGSSEDGIVVGFNVKIESSAKEFATRMGVEIETFNIIYELTEWVKNKVEEKTPEEKVEETVGRAKILKTFSRTKDRQVIGARLEEGQIKKGDKIKIIRREAVIGKAKVVGLQENKVETDKVSGDKAEFGGRIESVLEIVPGDFIESFNIAIKK